MNKRCGANKTAGPSTALRSGRDGTLVGASGRGKGKVGCFPLESLLKFVASGACTRPPGGVGFPQIIRPAVTFIFPVRGRWKASHVILY